MKGSFLVKVRRVEIEGKKFMFLCGMGIKVIKSGIYDLSIK